jgi:hypothetical protein
MREVLRPAAATGCSTTSCQVTRGRSGAKLLFGVSV